MDIKALPQSNRAVTERTMTTTPSLWKSQTQVNTTDGGTVFLQERFDLTAAEARLALHLVGGNSLKSAAKALNIGYETARTTLKSVFHKTGTCRQVELVILVIHAMNEAR
jgi:DNA-binding CsgD family transcriptional regulator